MSRFIAGLSLIVIASTLAACGSSTTANVAPTVTPTSAPAPTPQPQTGILEGQVTIGPLVPVERIGVPTPTTPPEAYAARSLDIFQPDGATLVVNVKIDSDGTYRVELPPGTYVVKLASTGIDRGVSLPQTVEIVSGQSLRLDFDIDTGIR